MLTQDEKTRLSCTLRMLLMEYKKELLERQQYFTTKIERINNNDLAKPEMLPIYKDRLEATNTEIRIVEKALQTNLYIESH